MRIRPTEYKVLVEFPPVQEKTSGGIYLPDETKDHDKHAAQKGTIVDMSPLAFSYADEWPEGTKPEIGDEVILLRYSGIAVPDDDTHRLVNDKDIAAVIKD